MDFGNYLINFGAIGLAVAMGIILALIWFRGVVEVTEPRGYVLAIEIFIMLAIIALAIYNLVGMLN